MKSRKLTIILLIFYLLVLSWIILLKTRTSFALLDARRSINLIPFGGMAIRNGLPNYNEIIYNILVFVPFGVLICLLRKKKPFVNLIVPVMLLSLFFEVIQYIFAIGSSDITDILANTFGGVIGIGIFFIFYKICKENVVQVVNISALVLAIGLALFIGMIRFF
jgi:glycopeptide antibiotics resistance protein